MKSEKIKQRMATIKAFVKSNRFTGSYPAGWGNGYVAIPVGHPFHGMDYNAIEDKYQININGGLTFSDPASELKEWGLPEWVKETDWIIGFDTAHYGDTPQKWPNESSVLEHAEYLAKQCENPTPNE